MNKNNERQLKEIAKKGFALKLEIQKCEARMQEINIELAKLKTEFNKNKANKTKYHKDMLSLF